MFDALYGPTITAAEQNLPVPQPLKMPRSAMEQGLDGIASVGLEVAEVLEGKEQPLQIKKKALLYQPDLTPDDPFLELDHEQNYGFDKPALLRVGISNPKRPFSIEIRFFPIAHAQYGRFQSLAGVTPDEAE